MEKHFDVYVKIENPEYTIEVYDRETSLGAKRTGYFRSNDPHPEFEDWVGDEILSCWRELGRRSNGKIS